MKQSFFSLIFLLLANFANAQMDVDTIFKQSDDKLNAIHSGSYRVNYFIKYFTKKDTSHFTGTVVFAKDQSLSGPLKYRFSIDEGQQNNTAVYDGNYQVNFNTKDSIAYVVQDTNYLVKGNIVYNLLFNPFLKQSFFKTLIAENNVDSITVDSSNARWYKIGVHFTNDTSSDVKNVYASYSFRKTDLIPVQYEFAGDLFEMHQYSLLVIDSPAFNTPVHFTKISVDSLALKYWVKRLDEDLSTNVALKSSGPFPEWKLISVSGDSLSSDRFRNKIIFYDFWYKSCFPCMKAMPAIQKLYEKYNNQGFQVVGLNPYDNDTAHLTKFLNQRDITFPSVVGAKPLAQQLNVRGYPSYFLVDKNNHIIYSGSGYSDQLENFLEEKIKQQLDIR